MTSLAYRQTYQLSERYSVEFILDGSHFECSWSPSQPKVRKARRLLPAYRTARNDFLASLGVNALVVEL